MKFYKIENNKLITGSGKTLLEGFTEFTTSFDEEGNEVFPAEMQPYLEAEAQEQEVATQIAEAKEYLTSTDFYFTLDKYATLSEERKLELNTLRAEARVLINSLEG
jgi:hypothetical protein